MCVVVSKYFKETGWVLAKNRDRNYEPEIKMVQRKDEGVERLFLYDIQTGYSEGLNEFGVCIISAATAVKSDEKEHKEKKAKANGTSKDGKRIRRALKERTAKAALQCLIEHKIPGNTFVTDGKVCYLLESGYGNQEDREEGNYNHKVIVCEKHQTYVRTNHGIELPQLGYQLNVPHQRKKRESSNARYEISLANAKKAKDPQELLNSIGVTPNKDPQMNPIRLKKNTPEDMLTTGQILLIPDQKTLTYRPTLSKVELSNYNKINGVASNTYFEIISNRQLTTFKDFVKK